MITTAGSYLLDTEHSRIGFVIRQMMISKVPGYFEDFEGSIYLDSDDPSRSTARLAIRAGSIQTANKRRDAHLRKAFLATEDHPTITFTSTKVEQTGETTFDVTGPLTIRGVTHPVTIAFQLTGTPGDQVTFSGTATIDRRDWGVAWHPVPEGGGAFVANAVTLVLTASAVRRV
jgi:polyisoprenoid-binding protein YceI